MRGHGGSSRGALAAVLEIGTAGRPGSNASIRSSTACGARASRHLAGEQRGGSLTFLALRAASRDADTEPSTGSLLWQLGASATLTRISACPAPLPSLCRQCPASVSPAASRAEALAPPRGSREVGADLSSRKTHTGVRAYRLIPSFHCKAVLKRAHLWPSRPNGCSSELSIDSTSLCEQQRAASASFKQLSTSSQAL